MQIFDRPNTKKEKPVDEQEIEGYLKSALVLDDDDILTYWEEHSNYFPWIAAVARDVLVIPASNTSVERLLLSSKNTISDKRTKLGTEKLNKLIFLQKNLFCLRPYPPSEIDFRYSTRDLSETFRKCWARKSKLPRFILAF